MNAQTWTVDVRGTKHAITVEEDPQSHRATIRVNGRITAAPMRADEDERELSVGEMRYIVRRLEDGKFDLDVPPEVFLNRAARSSGGRSTKKWGLGKAIGAVVVLVIVVGLLRFGRAGLQYMTVQWQPYAAPDGTFKAKFPSAPEPSVQSQNINGDIWTVNSLYSDYKNHGYAVQYLDLKVVVVDSNAESIMNDFFAGWMSALHASVQTKEMTSLARNRALNFVATIPAGAGPADEKLPIDARLRGMLLLRDRRLFLVWTVSGLGDPFSNDLRQFLDGFETTAPPERPATLLASVEGAPEPVKPALQAAAAAPNPEPTAEQRRQETEKRRAAEPQIYLDEAWKMYHVAGCSSVTPAMQKVAVEQRPMGYTPHLCVPDNVRNWTWSRNR